MSAFQSVATNFERIQEADVSLRITREKLKTMYRAAFWADSRDASGVSFRALLLLADSLVQSKNPESSVWLADVLDILKSFGVTPADAGWLAEYGHTSKWLFEVFGPDDQSFDSEKFALIRHFGLYADEATLSSKDYRFLRKDQDQNPDQDLEGRTLLMKLVRVAEFQYQNGGDLKQLKAASTWVHKIIRTSSISHRDHDGKSAYDYATFRVWGPFLIKFL